METANKPSEMIKREELFAMVWKEPATRLAERYNIPYSDFKKICDKISVPLPGAGYWSKLRAGKPAPEATLPTDYTGPQEVTIEPRTSEKKITLAPNPSKEVASDFKRLLKVPAKLTSPDPLIVAAKEKLEKPKYLHDGMAWSGSENISISVSPKNVPRALRFMDALIKVLKARGYNLKVENHTTYAIVEGEKLEIRLREKSNRNIIKEGSWDRTINTPSGMLIFKLYEYPGREWRDGKLLLEDRLEDIVACLEQEGKERKERFIIRQKEEKERWERERI